MSEQQKITEVKGEVIGHSIKFTNAKTRPYYDKEGRPGGQVSLPPKLRCILLVGLEDGSKISATANRLEVLLPPDTVRENVSKEEKIRLYEKFIKAFPLTTTAVVRIKEFKDNDWKRYEVISI